MVCRVVRRRRQVEKILLGVWKKEFIRKQLSKSGVESPIQQAKHMRQLEENVNRLVTIGWSTYS